MDKPNNCMLTNVDTKTLDAIVKKTINAVKESEHEIYDIYDSSCRELGLAEAEAAKIRQQTREFIATVDRLDKEERHARLTLAKVSQHFDTYAEEDIRAAYENSSRLQTELAVARLRERELRRRRDEVELRMYRLKLTVDKAEKLVAQVAQVLGCLSGEMSRMSDHIEGL